MPNTKKGGELIHQVPASMDVAKGQDHCFQPEQGLQNPKNDHGEVSEMSTLPFPLPKLSLRYVVLATDDASSHTPNPGQTILPAEPQKLFSRHIRPPRPHSPNLSPYYFGLVGHLKGKLDSIRLSLKEEPKASIEAG